MATISPERRARLQQEAVKNASNTSFYSTKNLTNDKIRLVPLGPEDDVGVKFVRYFLNNKSYVCNEETHQQPGVIAKARRALSALGTPEALAAAAAIKDARRGKWLMKIISRQDPTKPKWFEAPWAIYKVCYDAMNTDGDDITHPKEGRDVRISKEGSGKSAEYSARVLPEAVPLAPTKEERTAIRESADKMLLAEVTKSDEAGALDALQEVIPASLWRQISAAVTGQGVTGEPRPGKGVRNTTPGTDDAPAPAAKPAKGAADEDADPNDVDEEPAAPPRAATPARTAAAPVATQTDDDEDAPRPAANGKSATARPAAAAPRPAPAAAVDDDDDLPARPAPTRTTGKAVTVADDEEAAPPARKQHQVDDDE